MEVTQFYLHLPSNSSLHKFPNNTLTEYRVGLPQTINLKGDWEVALTEVHYPLSWNSVQGNFLNRFLLRNQDLYGVWEAMIIPPGHYSSTDDVIAKMNELVDSEKRFKYNVKFSYDSLSRKVILHLQSNSEIDLGNIGCMFGFQSSSRVISKTTTAEREVDLEYGFHYLYIYCAICSLTSHRSGRRGGRPTHQQVILAATVHTCQQKAV